MLLLLRSECGGAGGRLHKRSTVDGKVLISLAMDLSGIVLRAVEGVAEANRLINDGELQAYD